jgi:hypothetical protein
LTAKNERIALFGVVSNITVNNIVQLCSGILNERVGVAVNPYIKNGSDIFGSEYLAAYIAGIVGNPDYDSGEPISGKVIALDYIDDPFLTIEKRMIGQAGGILVQQSGADYKIVHYLSTDQTDIIKSELKIAKQKDSIKKSIRQNLEKGMINTRAFDIAIPRAQSMVRMILDEKKRRTEINDYKNLSIAFDPNDPRQLNISFLFKPTFDINYILVTFGATIS